jgi:hypothetical protein
MRILKDINQAAEDSAAAAARKLAQGAVTESNEMTVDSFFKAFKEAPGKLLSRFGVGAPEEIEMDSVEVPPTPSLINSLPVPISNILDMSLSINSSGTCLVPITPSSYIF